MRRRRRRRFFEEGKNLHWTGDGGVGDAFGRCSSSNELFGGFSSALYREGELCLEWCYLRGFVKSSCGGGGCSALLVVMFERVREGGLCVCYQANMCTICNFFFFVRVFVASLDVHRYARALQRIFPYYGVGRGNVLELLPTERNRKREQKQNYVNLRVNVLNSRGICGSLATELCVWYRVWLALVYVEVEFDRLERFKIFFTK